MARRIVPWLGIAALLIGYPLLAHYTNESAHSGNLGALVAIAPVVLIALALAWRSPRRIHHAGCAGAVVYCAVGRMVGARASFRAGLLAATCGSCS